MDPLVAKLLVETLLEPPPSPRRPRPRPAPTTPRLRRRAARSLRRWADRLEPPPEVARTPC